MDTPHEQLHMEQFSLKEIQKLADWLQNTGLRENAHIETYRKGWNTLWL